MAGNVGPARQASTFTYSAQGSSQLAEQTVSSTSIMKSSLSMLELPMRWARNREHQAPVEARVGQPRSRPAANSAACAADPPRRPLLWCAPPLLRAVYLPQPMTAA